MYDGILRLKNPMGTTIIGFAHDKAIVVVAKKLHDMETTCASMVTSIRTWLQKAGLELAGHKTEAVTYFIYNLTRKPEIGQGLGRILSCGARKPELT